MFKDNADLKDIEKVNIDFSNIINYKADVSPMDFLSNSFKSSILSGKYVIYKNENYDNVICDAIEKVLRWYDLEGRREALFLEESLEGFDLD